MRASATAMLLGIFAAGCAARSGPPPQSGNEAAKDAKIAGTVSRKSSRWREMTWAEYYSDVKERAFRRNANVIWIYPPRVARRPVEDSDVPTPCAR